MTKKEIVRNIERAIQYFDRKGTEYMNISNTYHKMAEERNGDERCKAMDKKNFGKSVATCIAGDILKSILNGDEKNLEDYFRQFEI